MIDQNFKVSNEKLTPKETHDIIRGIDENGNEILNQYTILLDIGEGSFSRIKLFIDNNTDIQYAAKIINIKELEKKRRGIKRTEQGKIIIDSCLKNALREIAILKRLSCENIIQLNEIIYDDFHSRIYLILDFADKGQILDFDHEHEAFTINKDLLLANREEYYTEDEIRDYMKGICNAVNYLHNHGIVHRDIKPDNILLDKQNIPKLTDFNVSTLLDRSNSNKLDKAEGTAYFYCPEMCTETSIDNKFDAYPLDIWALGVTLYSLVYLKLPFSSKGKDLDELFDKIQNKEIEFPNTRQISNELKDLIIQLLKKNPTERPTIKEVLKSPWLNKGDQSNTKQEFKLINVTDEEIEESVAFFFSTAQSRNNDLLIKEEKTKIKLSNKSLNKLIKTVSTKDSLSLVDKSTASLTKKPTNEISNNSLFKVDSSFYFNNKSNKSINDQNENENENEKEKKFNMNRRSSKRVKSVLEDEFFDN